MRTSIMLKQIAIYLSIFMYLFDLVPLSLAYAANPFLQDQKQPIATKSISQSQPEQQLQPALPTSTDFLMADSPLSPTQPRVLQPVSESVAGGEISLSVDRVIDGALPTFTKSISQSQPQQQLQPALSTATDFLVAHSPLSPTQPRVAQPVTSPVAGGGISLNANDGVVHGVLPALPGSILSGNNGTGATFTTTVTVSTDSSDPANPTQPVGPEPAPIQDPTNNPVNPTKPVGPEPAPIQDPTNNPVNPTESVGPNPELTIQPIPLTSIGTNPLPLSLTQSRILQPQPQPQPLPFQPNLPTSIGTNPLPLSLTQSRISQPQPQPQQPQLNPPAPIGTNSPLSPTSTPTQTGVSQPVKVSVPGGGISLNANDGVVHGVLPTLTGSILSGNKVGATSTTTVSVSRSNENQKNLKKTNTHKKKSRIEKMAAHLQND